jgi:hypothetical protein
MGTKLLYSASLERHLAAYRQELNMQELNDQWQLLQARIAREGERMGLDQAAIMNRIEQTRIELKQQATKEAASLESTNMVDTTTTARKAGAKAFVESTINEAMSNLEKGKRRAVNTPIVSRALNVQTPRITTEVVQSAKSNLRQTPARETKLARIPPLQQEIQAGAKAFQERSEKLRAPIAIAIPALKKDQVDALVTYFKQHPAKANEEFQAEINRIAASKKKGTKPFDVEDYLNKRLVASAVTPIYIKYLGNNSPRTESKPAAIPMARPITEAGSGLRYKKTSSRRR